MRLASKTSHSDFQSSIEKFSWSGGDTLYQAYSKVFSTYEKAEAKVRELIEADKKQTDYSERHEYTEEIKKENGVVRFWLYWRSCGGRCSHCWEIIETEVE